MKNLLFLFGFSSILSVLLAADVRLVDLDPPEAQQQIEQQDQSLHYAPKVESNVPAVRYLGNEPHNVLEDIYLARQYHGQDGIGGYLYGYNIPDIAKTEKKVAGGDLRGAYNYINDDGTEIKVEYWDDGTGFHQIDNVPKILPKPIEESPEVKAEKDKFLARWQEEAERNQRPVASPYDAEGNYASGPLSLQGQAEFKKMFENQPQGQYYQQPSSSSGVYQQNGQYQPAGQYQQTGQYQQPGQYHQSGQIKQVQQPGSLQQGQYYQSPQSQSSGKHQQPGQYQPTGQYQQPGQQGSVQQLTKPNQIDYTGAYSESQNSYANPTQNKPSGQYTPVASSSNQYSQQGGYQQPGQHQQGAYQQTGTNQQPGSYQQGAYHQSGANQQPGSYQQGGQYHQSGQYQHSDNSKSNQVDNSGDYDKSWDNEGQYDKKYDEEEGSTGPPKGFFYSFDYPVGKIVQKGEIASVGALKNAYSQNKAAYESQVSSGHSGSAASQSSYSYGS